MMAQLANPQPVNSGIPYGIQYAPLPIQLPANSLGKQRGKLWGLGPMHLCGRPRKASSLWLLASDRLSSSHCSHLGSEQ